MLKLIFVLASAAAQKRSFYGKILESQGPKLACQIYHDMALYDFRALGVVNQTFDLDEYKLDLSLCEMIEDCGYNSFAFLKKGTKCYHLS